MNFAGMVDQYRLSFSKFWAARDARERTMLSSAAATVMAVLIYSLLIYPALSGRERLNKNLPELRQQVAQLQALAKEAASFSGKPAVPAVAISRESIEAALSRNGLKPQSVILTGNFAKIQLSSVSFAGMLNWLGNIQNDSMLSVVDANIIVLPQADTVNATLTLRQQRNE